MAGAFRIAEGYVEVTADESGYDRAMQRLRQSKNKATVTLDIDDTAALAQLRRFADQHSRTVLKAVIDADLNEASMRRVTAKLDRLTADRTVRILATADTRVAADEIRNLTQRRRVRIGVDVDTRVAADDIANLTRRRTLRVTADADTADAAARLAALTRDRTVNIRANMSGLGGLASLGGSASGSAGGIGMLSSRIAILGAAAIGALPTVASLGQSIIAMGPAAAVAAPAVLSLATAFAAVKVGTSGIGDAFKAAFAPATAGASAATNSIRQVENAQRAVAKAQQGVKDAEQRAAEARVQAARRVEDAQRSLKATVQDVADANRRAAQQVAQAERDLADAQKEARQAQRDLNDARREAAQDLEDLNNRLASAQLDQRQAVLDVQDAEEELAAVKAKGSKATAEELEEAQLAYDRAIQRLKEQQTETARLTEETEAANKAGVEGSKTVVDAKQDIADANREVADRTRALRDAEIEQARTTQDGLQRIAAAERDVADAREAARKAAVDGARDIADAHAAVADAARALSDAQTAGAAAVNKLGDAMAKLSPNAREFVNAVIAQGAAWRGLKLDVQDALFRGLGTTFTRLSTAVIPPLRGGLVGMADNLNAMAKNAAGAVIELSKTGQLKQMFDGLNKGFGNLNRIPGQFLTGLTQLSIAASPAFQRITDAAGRMADRISQKISEGLASGSLEQAISGAVDIAKQFGQLLGDIFGTLGNIMKAAAAGGGDALGALGSVFAELRRITAMPEIQQALTSIFEAVNAIAKLFAGTLGSVLQAALPLLEAMAPVVRDLAEKLGPVLADLAAALGKALMPIIDALLPVVSQLGDILVRVVRMVMPLLKPIGDLLGVVISALAPVLPVVGNIVTILVGALVKGLQPVIAALIPAVATFGRFIGQLAPLLTPLYQAFAPLIPVLGQMSAALINLAMQVIEPLLPLIVRLAGLMSGVLAGAINTVVPVITTVVGWLTKFADKAAEVVKWVVDKFRWLYDVLVGHSIIPDLVREIVRNFTGLWAATKRIFGALKDWLVKTWRDLWASVRERWNSFWSGLRSSMSNAWQSVRNSMTSLRTSITNVWNGLWNGARDKMSSIFSTIRDRIGSFMNAMRDAFTALRDSLGRIWDGIKSKIASPVRYVVGTVYNNGVRRMWNTIAGKINSNLTLPAIKLGFNKGGVVPGTGNSDTVPAMLTPGERILSKSQVAQLGGQRGIDAMLGQDRPTQTGGNPSRQEERRRQQGPVQHFDEGGIVGNITSGLGKLGDAASWAKDLVVGGLKEAAQKALRSLVRPLIARIPNTGIGNLLRGLSNRAVDGMMGWFTKEDKKAVGGPGVQKALSWAKTQHGLPYQWGGNGNPSWDCSGLTSAIESVIRGERPHRRWATGSFVGNNGPSGWVRNLNSPYQIGITNSGVGHTAGTIAGVNVESRGGDGVVIGKRARSYKDPMFTSRWGFAPAAKFDSGGLLQPGATMAVNATGRPERILDPQQTAMFDALVRSGGGVTIENITVSGSFDFSTAADRRAAANALVAEMKEALRKFDRGRA
jgi:phage-related protein/phosphoribosylformylglycinamidine (FGAM) synthase PurS component